VIPEEHSVERGCDHDDGDEADHGQGGSLVHFLSSRRIPDQPRGGKPGGRSLRKRSGLGLPPEQASDDGA
jgi:hypothetical protein